MKKIYLLSTICLVFTMSLAQAVTPREQYRMDAREVEARYAEDRAICAEEKNQGQRMKCLRTAKAEQQQALAGARNRTAGMSGSGNTNACLDCGQVTNISVRDQKGGNNALGVIAGGAAGALLGNQVGGGSGKTIATVAGAVGGAYAGKKIQENMGSSKVWTVEVQYDNGERRSFDFTQDPGVQRGDRVKNAGQSIMRI